mmetsp:Transcript_88444/g.255097  ORF Transcript_88444/g.255097 Transcript_88444/m.255097 type:complete len:226 (-) Transcript_88444:15-692(-)
MPRGPRCSRCGPAVAPRPASPPAPRPSESPTRGPPRACAPQACRPSGVAAPRQSRAPTCPRRSTPRVGHRPWRPRAHLRGQRPWRGRGRGAASRCPTPQGIRRRRRLAATAMTREVRRRGRPLHQWRVGRYASRRHCRPHAHARPRTAHKPWMRGGRPWRRAKCAWRQTALLRRAGLTMKRRAVHGACGGAARGGAGLWRRGIKIRRGDAGCTHAAHCWPHVGVG